MDAGFQLIKTAIPSTHNGDPSIGGPTICAFKLLFEEQSLILL